MVARLRKHPLYRALRVDKVTLAAVEATLALWVGGGRPPVERMIDAPLDALRARAERLVERLHERKLPARCERGEGFVGGGSLPGQRLASWTVWIDVPGVADVAAALRLGTPAVVLRVAHDALCVDVRTVTDCQVVELADRLAVVVHRS